jgi:ATP-dependent DNA helicase RecG
MRTVADIRHLLDDLTSQPADSLEDQDLDFKEWNERSLPDSVGMVVDMAICMANGGGGTVVFGVRDKVTGRDAAILGVPNAIDPNLLKKTVYDRTDPRITPVFEDLPVPEGTGRLLVMQVFPGMPPHTDTSGKGTIRMGKDCMPLTGSVRQQIAVETGETDLTARCVDGALDALISPGAMEALREAARRERAPEDLLGMSDHDLLAAIDLLDRGSLTVAGLLLAGKPEALRALLPNHGWSYLQMRDDTEIAKPAGGHEALPLAVNRLADQISNPIETVRQGLHHFEYRTYPEIALREALLNAFCHRDYRLGGPVIVKQYDDRLEIASLGGFIGGINADNILHHPPASRNPRLIQALSQLRLVNRSNLGVPRMFKSLLIEGKAPPIIAERGNAVIVTFLASDLSDAFRSFVEDEAAHGRMLSVDHLLVLQHLLRHPEIDIAAAAALCQRTQSETREVLGWMERTGPYIERGGTTGRGLFWMLRADLHRRLAGPGSPERYPRIDWESAKTRVLSVLRQRATKGEPGLSNAEIRQLTHFNRNQVFRMMRELLAEEPAIRLSGPGRHARYGYVATLG